MKLPAKLSEWHDLLTLFPPDIAAVLGDLILKLSPLVGTKDNDELHGVTEPAGYSGITSKPHYERLLLSEWAVRDTHPDEFLRRAVSGEHQFLSLSRVEKRQNKVSVVLFDCGPIQLGRPRIVQLALLILLSRRAERSHAEFFWGVIQSKSIELRQGVTAEAVLSFLTQRSFAVARPRDVEAKLFALGTDVDDLWIVSPVDQLDINHAFKQIRLTEPVFCNDKVDVELHLGQEKIKRTQLSLPDVEFQARLLRNPLEKESKYSKPADMPNWQGWLIGCNGRQVAFLGEDGAVNVYGIPLKPSKNATQKVRKFSTPPGHELVGVNLAKRRLSALTTDRESVYFYGLPGGRDELKIPRHQLLKPVTNGLGLLLVYNSSPMAFVLDQKNRLRKLFTDGQHKPIIAVEENVVAMESIGECGVVVTFQRQTRELTLQWFITHDGAPNITLETEFDRVPKVFIHGSGAWSLYQIGCFAYEKDDLCWSVLRNTYLNGIKEVEIHLEAGTVPVGVLGSGEKLPEYCRSPRPCMICLGKDRGDVWAYFADEAVKLHDLPAPAKFAQLNSHHPLLHFDDKAGNFVTLDLRTGKELLRLEKAKQ